ncbi:SPT4H factor, partial [Polyodon spathula]|nr:SPT4H factor [Polyodon spathula]
MKGNREMVYDCTSSSFDGVIAMMSPEDSWVSKWQRISNFKPGVYAVTVTGRLPPDAFVQRGLSKPLLMCCKTHSFKLSVHTGVDETSLNDLTPVTKLYQEIASCRDKIDLKAFYSTGKSHRHQQLLMVSPGLSWWERQQLDEIHLLAASKFYLLVLSECFEVQKADSSGIMACIGV